jgi:two-component system, sensor histidine kinase
VLNLVSNALRYTDHGGVSVRARRRGEEIAIAVCDTGAGILVDQQKKIFEEFYRIRTADNERREGFGLGLAIVDRLSRLLKHRVELRSRVGGGSRFAVTVPRVAVGMPRTGLANWLPTMHDALPGRRIAVLDDDGRVAENIGGLLRSWGCKVFTAETETGIMADTTAGDRRLDLIIVDYHLGNG